MADVLTKLEKSPYRDHVLALFKEHELAAIKARRGSPGGELG
jgi:hypothetical protein